jgi:hypothetical protein
MSAPIIPCEKNRDREKQIEEFAEILRTQAHKLEGHGLKEDEFYASGLLDSAVQRIRGQISAKMYEKRDFVKLVLNHMQDAKAIMDWQSAGGSNRHDYTVKLLDGRTCAIELKGCLDGNNVNIYERPAHAEEFILWSVCNSRGADPRRNAWSGITRLGVEEIENAEKKVDGLVVWDWNCGTLARPCPKLKRADGRLTTVGQHQVTPPCIYLFPRTVPSVRNNPDPEPYGIADVGFLQALHTTFGGMDDELHTTRFKVANKGNEVVRTTEISRGGVVQHASRPIPIRRK